MHYVLEDGHVLKMVEGRCLLLTAYILPDGYRVENLMNDRYLLVRKSDGEVIARVDDLNLLLKRMKRKNFIMSVFEHDEWKALESFYIFCCRKALEQKKNRGIGT